MNVGKTQLTTFGPQKWRKSRANRAAKPFRRRLTNNVTDVYNLYLAGQQLVPSTTFKILGVTLKSVGRGHVTRSHATDATARAMQRINLLRRICGQGWGADQRTVLKLYKQYIRPVLEYGYVATAGTQGPIQQLELTERRALRIALRQPPWSRIEDLYRDARVPPLRDNSSVLYCNVICLLCNSNPEVL